MNYSINKYQLILILLKYILKLKGEKSEIDFLDYPLMSNGVPNENKFF